MFDAELIVLTAAKTSVLDTDQLDCGLRLAREYSADGLRERLATDWTVALNLVDLAAADADLIDRLQADGAPPSLFVLADDDPLRGRINLAPSVRGYLSADADAATIAAAVHAALVPRPGLAVGDFSDRDSARLNTLGREVERIARALNDLASEATVAPPVTSVAAPFIRAIIKRRRDRDRYFPAELFSDPAWDMLLDLTAARLERRVVSVSSLCIAAAVPTTTALRWIRNLCDLGLFERNTDPDDLRRGLITLSDTTAARMLDYLASIRGAVSPV